MARKVVKARNGGIKGYLIMIISLLVVFAFTGMGIAAISQSKANIHAQNHVPVCPGPAAPGDSRCHARVVVDQQGQPNITVLPSGYGPAQFLGAYNLSGLTAGSGSAVTIAIVDAYDHPNI